MNLARMIEEQLSGDSLERLSSAIGADPDTTGRATSAAVPTMLASLANLASNDEGARRLAGALNNVDTSALGGLGQVLSGDTGALLNKGAAISATSLRRRSLGEKAAIVAAVREHVWPLLADGHVRPVIDREIPMNDAATAHQVVEESGHVGKVLLVTPQAGL